MTDTQKKNLLCALACLSQPHNFPADAEYAKKAIIARTTQPHRQLRAHWSRYLRELQAGLLVLVPHLPQPCRQRHHSRSRI